MSINKNIISNVEWKKENNFIKNVKCCYNCKFSSPDVEKYFCTLMPHRTYIITYFSVCDKFKKEK